MAKVEEHFGKVPTVFRNTGMIYSNDLAARLENLGFKGVLAEGLDMFLKGRSYNQLYRSPNVEKIKTILKNYNISANITHHFNDPNWPEYPLTVEKNGKMDQPGKWRFRQYFYAIRDFRAAY